jgi:hypothetical protein
MWSWRDQPWGVIVALAAVLLVRPALSVVGIYDRIDGPWAQLVVTAGAYLIWIAAMLVRRDPNPVRTLALAGATYGAIVIGINPIVWVFLGAPDIPAPGYVLAPVAVIGMNALFGAAVGALAAGLQKLQRKYG